MAEQSETPARVCESDPDDPLGMLSMLVLRMVALRDGLMAKEMTKELSGLFRHRADVLRRTLLYTSSLFDAALPVLHVVARDHLTVGQFKLGPVSGTSACEALLNLAEIVCSRVWIFVDNKRTPDGVTATELTEANREWLFSFLDNTLGRSPGIANGGIFSEPISHALTCARGEVMAVALLGFDAEKPPSDESAFVAAKTLREQPATSANQWPRKDGWDFREGEAAFQGFKFSIQGVPWRLLKKLAEKVGTPVSEATLLGAMNSHDGNAGEGSLRSQLTRTRDILRAAFGLSSDIDPLPNVERGRDAAWKLDEKVFPSVSEIQRWLNGR